MAKIVFKELTSNQNVLFPVSLSEKIAPNHPVRVVNSVVDVISVHTLPAIAFVILMVLGFVTGSFWGMAAVCFPIMLPLAQQLDANMHLTIGAVIAGAAAGRGAGRLLGGSGQQRRERGRKCVLVRSSRFLEARFEPRRFFEARCTFGGVVPRGIVLAFGRFVSCGVLFVFVFDVGLVRQLAYNGDHGCKGQCVCAAAPEPAKTQQQKTVSDRKQCVQ